MTTTLKMQERILDLSEPDTNGGCWLWAGPMLDQDGYASVYNPASRRNERAHRASYEANVGPIPAGLVIDHKCRVRSCVNPDHLRVVSNKENVLCGEGVTARNAKKTKCHRGHSLSGHNLYMTPDGWRSCRRCRNDNTIKYKARRRAKTQASA